MRHLKTLILAALATMVLTVTLGTGTASAAGGVLCENTTEPCGTKWAVNSTMEFSLVKGNSAILKDTNGFQTDTCSASTVKASVTSTGTSTTNATETAALTFTGCTDTTAVKTPGTVEIASAGSGKGTVTAKGFGVTVFNTALGVTCLYTARDGSIIGTFTPGASDLDGVLKVTAVVERTGEHEGSFFCPETSNWNAEYTQTGMTPLAITAK